MSPHFAERFSFQLPPKMNVANLILSLKTAFFNFVRIHFYGTKAYRAIIEILVMPYLKMKEFLSFDTTKNIHH